jgi:peroxiredoxin
VDGLGGHALQQAEEFLRAGKKQAALSLLLEYLKQRPDSSRAWWMLSFAVTDLGQQIECVERVLTLDPGYAPAQTHLAKLKQMRVASLPSMPIERRPAPQPAPKKATSEWVLPVAVGSMLMCLMVVVFAVILVVKLPTARAAPSPAYGPSPTSQPFFLFQDSDVGTSEGDLAPDFTLNTLDDRQVTLSAYRGKPVLLFFWATWCHYCKAEMPSIQKAYQNYKGSGLVVLAVEVGESAADGRAFRKDSGYTFPILNDSRSQVFSLYDGTGFPTNYFIDADGRISYVAVGMMDEGGLINQVRALLGLQ